MKKGCLYSIGIFLAVVIGFIYMFLHAFDPEYDKVEIVQKIGGKLICNSVFNSNVIISFNLGVCSSKMAGNVPLLQEVWG